MNAPSVKMSLITACRNAERTIGDAIGSVFAQVGADVEYLVVDGGSTDGTVAAVRSWEPRFAAAPRLSLRWISEPDAGMYDAINKGIRMATGDVVGILNADDVLASPDVLRAVAAAFEGFDGDCRYGNVRFVKELGGRTHRVCFARGWRPWMLQWGYMPPHPAIFVRRACFARWGGYEPSRETYRIAADYELLVRFFRVHRMTSRYLPLVTTVMRTGGVSTRDVEARRRLNEEIVKANRANGYFCIFPMLLPKYLVKIWEFILPRLGFG